MRQEEAARLNDEIYAEVCKKGVPIDVRTGQNVDAAEWIRKLLTKHIEIDTPIGVVMGDTYDLCPRCGGIIGQSANYCKKCGAYVKEKMTK